MNNETAKRVLKPLIAIVLLGTGVCACTAANATPRRSPWLVEANRSIPKPVTRLPADPHLSRQDAPPVQLEQMPVIIADPVVVTKPPPTSPPSTSTPASSVTRWGHADIVALIRSVFVEDPDRAVLVAGCESSLNQYAVSRWDDRGLFQMHYPLWADLVARYGRWDDPDANVRAAHALWVRDGWGPWSSSQSCWQR